MKHLRLVTGIVLCALALGYLYSFMYARQGKEKSSPPAIVADKSYFIKSIQTQGGEKAYASFKKETAGLDPSQQHLAAHAFGGALFDVEGTHSLAVCDSAYGYGCAHQYIGSAIHAVGLPVVQELNNVCLAGPGTSSCQHGIGHGLVAYLGYQEKNLTESIALCGQYASSTSVQGCLGGVFMEYNLRTMLGSDAKPRTDVDLLSLCNSFSGVAGQSCAFYLAQWWWVTLPDDSQDQLFSRMDSLCGHLVTNINKHTCYEGVGIMAPPASGYKPQEAARLCEVSSKDGSKVLMCKAYAASVFLATGAPVNAKLVCEGLEGGAALYCMSYAKGYGNIDRELPLP